MDNDDIVGIRPADDLQEAVMRCAADEGRTIEDIVTRALRAYVNGHDVGPQRRSRWRR